MAGAHAEKISGIRNIAYLYTMAETLRRRAMSCNVAHLPEILCDEADRLVEQWREDPHSPLDEDESSAIRDVSLDAWRKGAHAALFSPRLTPS